MRILLLLLIYIHLYSLTNEEAQLVYKANKKKIDKVSLDIKQKETYQANLKSQENKDKFFKMKKILIEEKIYVEECIEIDEIKIENSSIFVQKDLQDLTAPYLLNCTGIKNLNVLINKISNMYLDKGFITSRAYLKTQDLSSGIVTISILEGKVLNIKSDDLYLKNIYTSVEGELLNLRELETGITQLERARSNDIILQLKPASKMGYTDVFVKNKSKLLPFHASLSISNNGNEQTGKYPINLSFTYDNLFGINDIVDFGFNSTNNISQDINTIYGYNFAYGIPYGKSYTRFKFSTYEYSQKILSHDDNDITTDGSSRTYNLNYEYKLYHNKGESLNMNLSLGNTNVESSLKSILFDDTQITVQSYISSNIAALLSYSYNKDNISLFTTFAMSKAISIMSATTQESDIKYSLSQGYVTKLTEYLSTKFTSTLNIQYTKPNKDGINQIGIGGSYSVRGFNNAGLSGYLGGYSRNEISIVTNLGIVNIHPYLGFDFGYIKEEETTSSGTIAGFALGSKITFFSNILNLSFSKALKHTEETRLSDDSYFVASYTYIF